MDNLKKNIKHGASQLSSIVTAIENTLEVPPIAKKGMSRVEITGNCEAVVDGCRGVLEYDDGAISLSLGNRRVRFMGDNLQIHTLLDEQAMITGTILSVEFLGD